MQLHPRFLKAQGFSSNIATAVWKLAGDHDATVTVVLTINRIEVSPCGCGSGGLHWAYGDLSEALGRPLSTADAVRVECKSLAGYFDTLVGPGPVQGDSPTTADATLLAAARREVREDGVVVYTSRVGAFREDQLGDYHLSVAEPCPAGHECPNGG